MADVMATGRGIVAGSVGAVAGCASGGGLGWAVYRWLDPLLEGRGGPLEELQGIVTSVVLVGGGVGLAVGCVLALRLRGYGSAVLTAILVLGVVPYATPLVALAGRLGWLAALVSGVLLVSGAVAGVRLLVTRTSDGHPARPPSEGSRGS